MGFGEVDAWQAQLLAADPWIARRAHERIIRGGGGTDACLHARRELHIELRDRRYFDGDVNDRVYRAAAAVLRADRLTGVAAALGLIADAGAEVAASRRQRQGRYRDRPLTAAERADAELLRNGRVVLDKPGITIGADRARYFLASLTSPGRTPRPVAIVTADTGAAEVVTGFRNERDRARWLTGRRKDVHAGRHPDPGRAVPLPGCSGGPESRTSREERVLAWLLRGGVLDDGRTGQLAPGTFTSDFRYEVYGAWRAAAGAADDQDGAGTDAGTVRDELVRRMLRTPVTDLHGYGWPYGHVVIAYLNRLAATPVSDVAARSAAARLAREDGEAAGLPPLTSADLRRSADWECFYGLPKRCVPGFPAPPLPARFPYRCEMGGHLPVLPPGWSPGR